MSLPYLLTNALTVLLNLILYKRFAMGWYPYDVQLDEFRLEIQRRDQEILAMAAKMKALEEQHQDYQRHIAVLKESLCAKEEHYSMLQADVRTN